ncbi:MAG: PRC-barrel domain-containing protein [Thermomicrobiales bacterium]
MQLDLGSHVKTSDGEDIGTVSRIIFDTDKLMVREFVVHEGVLLTHDRIVHRELVDRIDDDHVVYLKMTASDADDLPAFVAEQHMPIYISDLHYVDTPKIVTTPGSVPRDAVVLSHGSEVYDSADKHIGHLDEIVYDDEGVSSAFIVDSGFFFTHDVVVPVEAIKSIAHGRIDLKITADEAEAAREE